MPTSEVEKRSAGTSLSDAGLWRQSPGDMYQEFVCLTIQAPDSGCDRVIEVGGHEPIAGILSIEEVIGRFEQGQHLHDRVVLGISTVTADTFSSATLIRLSPEATPMQ